MKSMKDVLIENTKGKVDFREHFEYKGKTYCLALTWTIMGMCNDGIITDAGRHYVSACLLSEDGAELLDVVEIDKLFKKSELNKLYFVSDHEAYFKAIGLDNYEGLIGLNQDEFYKEINKRLSI